MRQALIANDYEGVLQSLGNTLEQSAFKLVPQIATIKQELLALGFDGALMSGSGSTVFALTRDLELLEKGAAAMKKEIAAIYCRLSVEDAEKRAAESESIRNQRALLLGYAKKQGWAVYDIYADEDYSGLREDRPAFQRLLADAEERKFSIILCKTQSRFTRNAGTAEKYLHALFPLWGIRFVTVVDGVDTASHANKKARQINSLVNEWYSEELSENIRAVFRRKMEAGQFLGNYAPYGYRKDPRCRHHLIPDAETAPVVEEIYDLYLSGLSCKMIGERLTAQGIPTPSEMKRARGEDLGRRSSAAWSKGTIRKILQNPVYLGHMVQGKEEKISFKEKKTRELPRNQWIVVEHTHEAIIKEEIFGDVKKRMAERRLARTRIAKEENT